MSIFDNEQFLPGVSTEIISEYQQTYDTTQWDTTDSVVVIGTAFNGPTGTVTPVWNPTHAQYLYGNAYNSSTRTEVDLLAGVQAAWDAGCRTIYCMRVGGKAMYKDFNLNIGNGYKLRVSSLYPTNSGKQAFFVYNDSENSDSEETITFYKIPDRATINERNQGLVESTNKMIKTEIRLNQDYGFTKDTMLREVIDLFNNHVYNNVLRLAIVGPEGYDITDSAEAADITLGNVFPGAYFIGRSENTKDMPAQTVVNTTLVFDPKKAKNLPYEGFSGAHFDTLVFNSDVSKSYPIYGSTREMREALAKVGISMIEDYDYLDKIDGSNDAFAEDDVDYEETNISDFEKYQKLGSGFAITATLKRRYAADGKTELQPKVIETKTNDQNRIIGVSDGIYSVLQDVSIDFRVLGSLFSADKVISGKLPKVNDFKIVSPSVYELVEVGNANDSQTPYLFEIKPKLDEDITIPVKKYNIAFKTFDTKAYPELTADNVAESSYELVPIVDSADKIDLTVVNGTRVLVPQAASATQAAASNTKSSTGAKDGKDNGGSSGSGSATPSTPAATPTYNLYVVNDGVATIVAPSDFYDNGKTDNTAKHTYFAANNALYESSIANNVLVFTKKDPSTVSGKTYVTVKNNDTLFLWKVNGDGTYTPVADYDSVKEKYEDDDAVFVYVESLPMNANKIVISSPHFEAINVQDFIESLNNNTAFNTLFEAKLTKTGSLNSEEYMKSITGSDGTVQSTGVADSVIDKNAKDLGVDHTVVFDYDKYIPYRTTDNFARQLAQHCTYTELKTGRTHGVIGCARLMDTSVSSIAKKVASVLSFNFDMYAKKNNGRNMLDNKNLPYNIGRNVSITLFQHATSIDNGSYTFLSNGAGAYAGMVSALDIAQSTTAQTISITPGYELSHSQLLSLTSKGIVTVRNSYTKGYIITDGVTMADDSDGLKRLSSTRIVGATEASIRSAAEPFIGKPNSTANRNSLQTAIESNLKQLKENGLLRSYEFSLVDDDTALQYTYITINYTIVPVNEIREVRNYITVKNSMQ